MKYVLFIFASTIIIPSGYALASRYRIGERMLLFFLILSTSLPIDINFYSREKFRLSSNGFEFTLTDILLVVFLLLVIRRRKIFKLKPLPSGMVLFLFYFLFSALSIGNAPVKLFSMFELFKMLRMLLFFWVMANYIRDAERFRDLIFVVSIVTIFLFFSVLKQRYFDNLHQTYGFFEHQNSLVMYTIVHTSLALSYLLNRKDSSVIYWTAVVVMGSLTIVFTLSRGGLGAYAISVAIIFALSFLSRFSLRKVFLFLAVPVVFLLILSKAYDSVVTRFRNAPPASLNMRLMLAESALNMADDKFFGVGLNNFGIVVNPPYTYSEHIPKYQKDEGTLGLVETVYLMVAAECGWATFVFFILWLLRMFMRNLIQIFRCKRSSLQYIPIGLCGALTGIYIESAFEWVLKQTGNFYQLMLVFALIAVIGKNGDLKRELSV